MELTKNQQVADMVKKTIDALVETITDSIKELTNNGEKEVNISAGEEWIAYMENGKVMFESEWEVQYPISAIRIETLIDINNAIVSGNYD